MTTAVMQRDEVKGITLPRQETRLYKAGEEMEMPQHAVITLEGMATAYLNGMPVYGNTIVVAHYSPLKLVANGDARAIYEHSGSDLTQMYVVPESGTLELQVIGQREEPVGQIFNQTLEGTALLACEPALVIAGGKPYLNIDSVRIVIDGPARIRPVDLEAGTVASYAR